jgi:hypothetical protein
MVKLFFFFFPFLVLAQSEDAWIYFNEKPNAQAYLNQPLLMLSQRSIERRLHHNIEINFTDVPIHQPYVSIIDEMENISVLAHSKWFNCVFVRGDLTNIQSAINLPFVSHIKYANKSLNGFTSDSIIVYDKALVNNKYEYLSTRNYGLAQTQINIHQGQLLHEAGFKGNNKIIAVLDSGFLGVNTATNFQHLFTENRILGGYNFVDRNDNPYSNHHHGTLVLSTMAINLENEFVGTAPEASYYLFVTEDINSETALEEALWVEAAERADALGVDIINTSLGYNTYDNANHSYTYEDMDGQTTFISKGSNMAFNKGIFCVTSAGNAGSSAWQYITAPADAINTLSVGAINSDLNYVNFSSIGPTSDGRVKPDVMALGRFSSVMNVSGEFITTNGTSFSAPITAGLVASLWQALPHLKNNELLQLIKENSSLFQNPTYQMGYGIPCFFCAYEQALSSENVHLSDAVIFPNPFQNQINIILDESQNLPSKLRIKNSLGQVIFEKLIYDNQSQLELNISKGLYFYEIEQGNKIFKSKIIKK